MFQSIYSWLGNDGACLSGRPYQYDSVQHLRYRNGILVSVHLSSIPDDGSSIGCPSPAVSGSQGTRAASRVLRGCRRARRYNARLTAPSGRLFPCSHFLHKRGREGPPAGSPGPPGGRLPSCGGVFHIVAFSIERRSEQPRSERRLLNSIYIVAFVICPVRSSCPPRSSGRASRSSAPLHRCAPAAPSRSGAKEARNRPRIPNASHRDD